MKQQPTSPQTEALYDYIQGKRSPQGNLPAQEGHLPQDIVQTADLVRSAAQQAGPDPQFAARLQAQLLENAQQLTRQNPAGTVAHRPLSERIRIMLKSISSPLRAVAWTALIAGLVVGLIWIIQNTLPKPPQPAYEIGTGTPIDGTLPPTLLPPASPTPVPATATPTNVYQNDSGQQVVLSAPLPGAPAEVMIYQQIVPAPLTVEAIKEKAAELGIQGHVYLLDNDSQHPQYILIDGARRLQFGDSLENFTYTPNSQIFASPSTTPPDFSQLQATATSFLTSLNLLDFPYRQQPPSAEGQNTVYFQYLIDGLPFESDVMMNGTAGRQVYFNNEGQILTVGVNQYNLEPVSALPIRSAEEALDILLNTGDGSRVKDFSWSSFLPVPPSAQWSRRYPSGQHADLYGLANILPAAEEGLAPYASVNLLPLVGDVQSLANQINPWQEVHVWGQVNEDEDGLLSLALEGWENSPVSSTYLTGTIQRQGEVATLVTLNGSYQLPDLPAEVSNDLIVGASGFIVDQTFEWDSISTNVGNLGGGGGGGGNFLPLTFTPGEELTPEPSPTPEPLPYADGGRVEGIQGQLYALVIHKKDGSQTANLSINFPKDAGHPYGWYATLEGAGIAGLEAFGDLPVRIWGTFEVKEDLSYAISVERYEEAYPGLRLQAWKGTQEVVILENQPYVQLTDENGEVYIINNTQENNTPDSLQAQIGPAGTVTVIVGYAYPDRKIGGHTVIETVIQEPAGIFEELDDYVSDFQRTRSIDEDDMGPSTEGLIIEKVELVYYLETDPFDETASCYAQPVWVFSGHYESGEPFATYIQAITDEYLKH